MLHSIESQVNHPRIEFLTLSLLFAVTLNVFVIKLKTIGVSHGQFSGDYRHVYLQQGTR